MKIFFNYLRSREFTLSSRLSVINVYSVIKKNKIILDISIISIIFVVVNSKYTEL